MDDVARHAGVSSATVSRALSGTRPMSDELRERVRDTAARLGYQVNLVGRTLRQRRSSTVGLIVPDLDNPFFSSLAQSLSRTFRPSGVDLLVFSADSDLETERRGIQSFLGRQVYALVNIATHERKSASNVAVATQSVVTVELDRRVASPDAHFIGCDNAPGMELIHEHVTQDVDTSEQPVVFVGEVRDSSSGRERLSAFRSRFGNQLELLGSFDVKWGLQAADEILAAGLRKATVVTAADVIALGVLSRLQTAGFRVPEDFRVIGFDGIGVWSLAHPTLTTVRQPVEAMSQAIVDMIVGDNPGAPTTVQRQVFRPTLVYGESSPRRNGDPALLI
jgi:LacI family transcriptional regulator